MLSNPISERGKYHCRICYPCNQESKIIKDTSASTRAESRIIWAGKAFSLIVVRSFRSLNAREPRMKRKLACTTPSHEEGGGERATVSFVTLHYVMSRYVTK